MAKNTIDFDKDFDFGIDFADDLSDTVEQKSKQAEAAQDKAMTMYKMIIPLLNNLKKNPDKPNIVWPDREKKINEFIAKLDSIINS